MNSKEDIIKEYSEEEKFNRALRLLELERDRKRIDCINSFYDFLVYFWDTFIHEEFEDNFHIEFICDELQSMGERVLENKPKKHDLIINVPPGSSKTSIALIAFPVWMWVKKQSIRLLTGSYSAEIAIDSSVKSRILLDSKKFKEMFPEISLRNDVNNKGHYMNYGGGERMTTSPGGSGTGRHAHIVLVDDPINTKKSASEVERKNANEWVSKTLSTRKVNKKVTPIIVIMQRLNEDDPTGHLLEKKKGKIKHICLPAEDSNDVKPEYLRAKYVNGLLDPGRMDREVLAESRLDLGSYGYAGQMMQRPSPDEGGLIKRAWFNYITSDEFALVRTKAGKSEPEEVVWDFFLDTAYTEKTKNDPNGFFAVTYYKYNLYIKMSEAKRMEFPALCEYTPEFMTKNGGTRRSKVYIEPKASGHSLAQHLKKHTPLNVVLLDAPVDSKEVRVHACTPFIESKRVYLLDGSWNEHFVNECATFPNGKHDDQVDNLTAAIDKFYNNRKKVTSYSGKKK